MAFFEAVEQLNSALNYLCKNRNFHARLTDPEGLNPLQRLDVVYSKTDEDFGVVYECGRMGGNRTAYIRLNTRQGYVKLALVYGVEVNKGIGPIFIPLYVCKDAVVTFAHELYAQSFENNESVSSHSTAILQLGIKMLMEN